MKNAVESILIVCFNPHYCKYYINNGGQKMLTYEKMIALLMTIVPELALDINYYIDRKLSFFIDVNDKKIQEVSVDREFSEENLRKEALSITKKDLQSVAQKKDSIKFQSSNNTIINRFFRREK